MNILNKIEKPYKFLLIFTFFAASLFDRSFIGLQLFGFRFGELIVGILFLQSLLIFTLNKGLIEQFDFQEFIHSLRIYKLIILTFVISVIYFQSNLTSTYTYKVSSYLWMCSLFFFSHYLYKLPSSTNNYFSNFVYLYACIPAIHYIFSSGYYPNFIMDFFIMYSDKFTFTKASDIMLVMVIANLILFNTVKNKNYSLIYFACIVPLLLPLLLQMSRGSFIGALSFFIMVIIFNLKYLITTPKFALLLIIFSAATFIFSTYRISGIDFDLSQGDDVVIDRSVSGNIAKIAKKNDTRKAFFSFYIENGRIVSNDNTTDWRLDIWQDVIDDLRIKKSIISGYGYNEIIPVMTDPSAPGRLGHDGLNENVHSYIFNILARGGIVQLILFSAFHLSFIYYWVKKNKNYRILLLMVPVFLNSATDMNMEGVQFPFLYFSFLGVYFKIYKNHLNKSSI
ncbi:O-antigen ligase family protein [Acidimicrobiia bacterium]|nr:O-antigen ligase family protein [Acidimicrobiia bacterium]